MITEQVIDDIVKRISEIGIDEDKVRSLRAVWPGIAFTHCWDDDICGPKPIREEAGFNVYLVGGEHCLGFTTQPETASGIVLAEVGAD